MNTPMNLELTVTMNRKLNFTCVLCGERKEYGNDNKIEYQVEEEIRNHYHENHRDWFETGNSELDNARKLILELSLHRVSKNSLSHI